MGTSTSVGELASKLQAGGKAIEVAEQTAMRETAVAGKAIMLANMGFTRMRGVGKKGVRVGVRYSFKPGQNPTVLLNYQGPVHLANNDTSAHRIEPKGGTRGKKAIVVGGSPRASANHPGTHGKQFFQRSKPQVAKVASELMQHQVGAALRSVF